jgi:hypothetical protein
VISTSAVAAPAFVAAALYPDVIQATVWRNHLLLVQHHDPAASPAPPADARPHESADICPVPELRIRAMRLP